MNRLNQPLGGNDMPRFGGAATMMRLPATGSIDGLDACFVGVPLDIGTSNRPGTRLGPRQIRAESAMIRPYNMATGAAPFDCMQVADIGDVAINTFNLARSVEIIERHHRFKEDAPSGTALKFGELIDAAFQADSQPTAVKHVHGREGKTGARTRHEIGYHAIRTGDNPGEHTIVFGMLGETIELKVAASNRDCYASGALAAAKWLRDKPPGLYSMFDVLGMQ